MIRMRQVQVKIRESPPEEKIASLERSKEPLLTRKRSLEAKIEELQARQRGEEVVRNEEKVLGTNR